MPDYMNPILLVGCGNMGREYCRVLQALHADIYVVGRGESSAKAFAEATGVTPYTGGLERFVREGGYLPRQAIVAVNVEELFETVKFLLANGVRLILVEKPAAGTYEQIQKLSLIAEKKQANIYVAYNRRFYASVRRAKELIDEDGGVSSFRFEFTEWSHKIMSLNKSSFVLNEWFLCNSTHVIDLAFYLGGMPASMCAYTAGSLEWNKKASGFSGAGITKNGASFSYYADWESAGRWSVEILTKNRKLILCPLEELHSQDRGKISVEKLEIEDSLDRMFKPGLYLQTKAFFEQDFHALLSLRDHANHCKIFQKMEKGTAH